MARTTRKELDLLASIITHTLECADGARCVDVIGSDHAYFIQSAYGQPRLMRAGGSVEVSPRLPMGELAQWMRAFLAGIDAARRPHADPVR